MVARRSRRSRKNAQRAAARRSVVFLLSRFWWALKERKLRGRLQPKRWRVFAVNRRNAWGALSEVVIRDIASIEKAARETAAEVVCLAPDHGCDMRPIILLSDSDATALQLIQVFIAVLRHKNRLHIHTCYVGRWLESVIAKIAGDPALLARLGDETRDLVVSGCTESISGVPGTVTVADNYVRCGCLASTADAHRGCCQRGAVRVVRMRFTCDEDGVRSLAVKSSTLV